MTGEEIEKLQKDNDEFQAKLLNNKDTNLRNCLINKVTENDEAVKQYIGFPNKEIMTGVFSIMKCSEGKLNYDRSGEEKTVKSDEEHMPSKKRGPPRKLPFFYEFILCMLRLKLGLNVTVLGCLFSMSQTSVTRIFNTWISLMHQVLVPALIVWPTREQIRMAMPNVVKEKFKNLTCIIDCFELFVQKPKSPTAQSQTYSSYKSHNTLKILISILPNGCINFVSSGWSGNVSDKYITANSGFMDYVQAGDVVMADRGFTIQDLLLPKKACLIIPPFTRKCKWGKGKKLNQSEIKSTRDIAQTRIHVERAIGRLKTFRLLSRIIPLKMKENISEIVSVACALCNLQAPLVK